MSLGYSQGSRDDGGFAALKQRIKRGDIIIVDEPTKVVDETPTKANLLQVKKPHFITAVGLPANETAFKVVREDRPKETKEGAKMATHPVLRRTRRSETSPVLRLTFPEGTDEETVNTMLKTYGMDGYKVEQKDGLFIATRADLKAITKSKTTDIALTEDGLVATVARVDGGVSEQEPKSSLTLSSFEFDSTKFTLEEVKRWAADKCVDGTVQEPQNPDECYVVRRSDVPENEETRRMVLEDGVQAVIVRSDVMNVPEGYVAVVNETAYGSWGWGQLDFMASMGDKLFNEALHDALYTLDDVLRNTIFYSALPLDVRKELANRVLAQFGDYIGNVMDSLPRQLLASVVRSANHTQQEKTMTTETNDVTAAAPSPSPKPQPKMPQPTTPKPSEQEPSVLPPAQAPEAPARDPMVDTPPTNVSRADVQKMIEEAVTKAVAAARGEAPKAEEGKTEEKPVQRADLESAVAAIVAPMTEAIKALQGTTVLRAAAEAVPEKEDPKTKDVFRGAFGGLRMAKR